MDLSVATTVKSQSTLNGMADVAAAAEIAVLEAADASQ